MGVIYHTVDVRLVEDTVAKGVKRLKEKRAIMNRQLMRKRAAAVKQEGGLKKAKKQKD